MGSLLIFIIPVIKTKESVSFKSALSGIHQVQNPLPESVRASAPQPISQSQYVWRGWYGCDWITAFWNQETAGNLHWVQLCQQAVHHLTLFALCGSQNVGHNAYALKRDLKKWNEKSKAPLACSTLSFLPAWIMMMTLLQANLTEAISSQALHNSYAARSKAASTMQDPSDWVCTVTQPDNSMSHNLVTELCMTNILMGMDRNIKLLCSHWVWSDCVWQWSMC